MLTSNYAMLDGMLKHLIFVNMMTMGEVVIRIARQEKEAVSQCGLLNLKNWRLSVMAKAILKLWEGRNGELLVLSELQNRT